VSITAASEENLTDRIPAQFNRAGKLSVDVEPGENSFDFQTTSE